ncbi:MAG: aldo/keto reductase, partial [bacterium]
IAAKHGKTIPQIVLRWILDRDIVPLSKSVTPERIQSNFAVFDFHLDAEDREKIATLASIGRVGSHPDKARF